MNVHLNQVSDQLQKGRDVGARRPSELFFTCGKDRRLNEEEDIEEEQSNANEPRQPFLESRIELPLRYRSSLRAREADDTLREGDVTSDVVSDQWKDRERDLGVALKWLRQEIVRIRMRIQLLDAKWKIQQRVSRAKSNGEGEFSVDPPEQSTILKRGYTPRFQIYWSV